MAKPDHDSADKWCYEYPRPALTVDCVILSRDVHPRVLLIQRKRAPFARCWALPGGFVNPDEPLLVAAQRELHEETGVLGTHLEQLLTAGDPGRDPRGWVVSVVYVGVVDMDSISLCAADDARQAKWHKLSKLPKLAFDHQAILEQAQAWYALRYRQL